MKKILFFICMALMMAACGNSNTPTYKAGDEVTVKTKCIWASDEESFEQMTKYCNRKDEMGLEKMEALGQVGIVYKGTKAVITDLGFGKAKIRLDDGSEVWVSSEFLK